MKKYNLPISGMTCASCVTRVEKVIGKIENVENISVNLATGKVSFETDTVPLEKIASAINKYGYELKTEQIDEDESVSVKNSTEDIEENSLKKDLLLSAIFTIPIFLISMLMEYSFFKSVWTFDHHTTNKILLVLTTPVVIYAGRRFFKIAWINIKHFSAEMNTLVAVGSGSAFIYSLIVTLFPELIGEIASSRHVYFETSAVIITLILFGRWLELRSKKKTTRAIRQLIELKPKTTTVLRDNKESVIKLSELKTGDIIVMKPGERIPADGNIISGYSTVDESMLTGESFPVEKDKDSSVIGGTLNLTGSFNFKIEKLGDNSVLGQIISLVEKANLTKPPIQKFVDKVAGVFVPVVIVIAIFTFAVWMIFPNVVDFNTALTNFIAVLIIACPCALGLATPTAIIVATGLGASRGILIKNGESLELARDIDTIVFDKTGTLTSGSPEVTDVINIDLDESMLLYFVGSLEKKSNHPLAVSITNFIKGKNIVLTEPLLFEEIPGFGLSGIIDNKKMLIGNSKIMFENNVDISPAEKKSQQFSSEGKTIIYVSVEGKIAGLISAIDPIKKSSYKAVELLHQQGLKLIMLTGDNYKTAAKIAAELNIDDFKADVLPGEKTEIIEQLQEEGRKVAMVGDGINDSPALAQAHLGIAMGNGTDIAIESSDITLLKGDLLGVSNSIKLSHETIKTIKQNLFWAFIYNTIGIPLAAFGLLNPMIAATAMAFSSVSVVTNSLRLRNRKL